MLNFFKYIKTLISLVIVINLVNYSEAFSECKEFNPISYNIPSVDNCLSLLAYFQSQGQNVQKWCENQQNFQKCCLTCQNYLRLPSCVDIASEAYCFLRARSGQCDVNLGNNIPIKSYCPKSCGVCKESFLTCDSVFIGCNTGTCKINSGFSVSTISCVCPLDRGGPYCNLINSCYYSKPCQNGGICTPSYEESESSYTCQCKPGCWGANCENCGCNSYSCFNGGYCALNQNAQPYCICPTFYTGKNCESLINACDSNPCQNRGQCSSVFNFEPSYICTCPAGCNGRNCENCNQLCNARTCFNGGYCVLNSLNQPRCLCPAQFTGEFCENQIPIDICIRGDINPQSCNSWALNGYCNSGFLYLNVPVPLYCPRSCGLCNFYLTCNDNQVNCDLWAKLGYCGYLISNYPNMCNRSCNSCRI